MTQRRLLARLRKALRPDAQPRFDTDSRHWLQCFTKGLSVRHDGAYAKLVAIYVDRALGYARRAANAAG